MKNIILAIGAVLVLSIGGCLSATVDIPGVEVSHSFTAPNDIPGCPIGPGNCPSPPLAVPLPPITQHIDFKAPAGVDVSAWIEEMDITSPSGAPLSFITGIKITVSSDDPSAPGPSLVVDYAPSVVPNLRISLFPDDVNVVPYLRGNTSFAIVVTGTVPDNDVPLDALVRISAEGSYKRSL